MAGDIRESYCHIPQENWERAFGKKEEAKQSDPGGILWFEVHPTDEELKALLELQPAQVSTDGDREQSSQKGEPLQ